MWLADTGETTYQPISETELNSIKQILIGTVGLVVTRRFAKCVGMQFAELESDVVTDVPVGSINFNDWVRWFASALVVIVVILVLVRPAMNKLINPASDEDDDQMYGPDGMPIGADGETSLIGGDLDGGELFEFGSSIDLSTCIKMKMC